MKASIVIHKKWLYSDTPQDLSLLQLDKLVLICAGCLALRICKTQAGTNGLELLCVNERELSEAEAIIHQALADERLRERISSKGDKNVASLVESIFMRTLGR